MCYQTVLKFCISLRVTFSNSIAFTVINKYDKPTAVYISTVLGPIYHVACPTVRRSGTFWIFI